MQARRTWVLIFVALILGAGVLIGLLWKQGGALNSLSESVSTPASSSSPPSSGEILSSGVSPTRETPRGDASLRLSPPLVESVQSEVKNNPHQTPPSLLAFSRELTAKTREAKKSEQAAAAFFPELEACAEDGGQDGSKLVQVQALCLDSAKELGRLFPQSLQERLESLSKRAPPKAEQLLKAVSELGQSPPGSAASAR